MTNKNTNLLFIGLEIPYGLKLCLLDFYPTIVFIKNSGVFTYREFSKLNNGRIVSFTFSMQ